MFIYSIFNRNLTTMERVKLLSFNSTDDDDDDNDEDCGLPYLCSNSGCNETQPIFRTPAFKAALRPWSSTRDGRKDSLFPKK